MPQFLLDPADLDRVAAAAVLRGDEAHHLVRVHRARPGDEVTLFDGRGHRWRSRFAGGDARLARLEGVEPLAPNESPLALHLLAALPKGDRWDWILEKGTELGVTGFRPVYSARSVSRIAPDRVAGKLARWRKQVLAAAKQCERGRLPEVSEPRPLEQVLADLAPEDAAEARVVLAERAGARPTDPGPFLPRRVLLAVGPEGGWERGELGAFERASFHPWSLGPRILRAESAVLAGAALVQMRWGDLEGPAPP